MRRFFHGDGKKGPYFEGWYLRCQGADGRAIALIPAVHIDSHDRRSVSLQVVSDTGVWWLGSPEREVLIGQRQFRIQIGANVFSEAGISLEIQQPGLSLHGKLRAGPFLPLRSDIMGPFRFLSGMECAHGVISMGHPLQGALVLNGEELDFNGGSCYIETDRGRAFPEDYLWARCSWPSGAMMLSVATIPFLGIRFTGCICAVIHHGKEYRLATYRGVKVEHWSGDGAVIRQGRYRLEIRVLDGRPQPLRAPMDGAMVRTIHERLCAGIRCRFWVGADLLFDQTDRSGSFEYSKLSADGRV